MEKKNFCNINNKTIIMIHEKNVYSYHSKNHNTESIIFLLLKSNQQTGVKEKEKNMIFILQI